MSIAQVHESPQVSTPKQWVRPSVSKRFATCTLLLLASNLPGCSSSQPREKKTPQAVTDVFGRPTTSPGTTWGGDQGEETVRIPSNAGPSAWTIVLAALPTDDPAHAEILLQQVRTIGRLPDAFIMDRAGKKIIAVGSFRNPTDPIVRAELQRVQDIQVDGSRLYENAFLVPPSGELSRGSIPAYDLRNVHAEHGKRAVYTLQIAVYSREDGRVPTPAEQAEIRQIAEKAVVALRQAGEQAFYYHGPNRSMVTIGIFGEDDHDVQDGFPIESPRLASTRTRHPFNLLNGRTILETTRTSTGGRSQREQSSFLVAIPKN